MKRKTKAAEQFLGDLSKFIEKHLLRHRYTLGKSEAEIQRGLRPLFVEYLNDYYRDAGYQNFKKKAHDVFYWEGQDEANKDTRVPVFAARNYPDFIIREPYRIAIEYKQSESGALVKQGIGQALMHILNGEYDFAYLLFDDQTKDEAILKASKMPKEREIAERLWKDFNIKLHVLERDP